MAIEITSNSIVKVLIRRGTDSERQLTTLTEGELGYCIDTQRLFIGDGITPGGIVSGNKFLGFVGDPSSYNSIAQDGDIVYQTAGTTGTAQRLVVFQKNGASTSWEDIHPKPYVGTLSNNFKSLEKSTQNGRWRLSREFLDIGSSYAPSGLTVKYEDDLTGGTLNSITQLFNRLDFDCRYISLSADTNSLPASGSFYFGNINNKAISNNLDATVNVDNSLYISSNVPGAPFQLKVFGQDPRKNTVSTIEAVSGGLDIRCAGANSAQNNLPLSLYIGNNPGYQLQYNSAINTLQTVFSAAPNRGSYGIPNFDFRGITKFGDDVYYAPGADVTIYGNLSVFGDATYIDTTVTTTSALSVVNNNNNLVTLFVEQKNQYANDQAIAIFKEGSAFQNRPALVLRDQGFVAINCPESETWSNNGQINFNVAGSTLFKDLVGVATGTSFTVQNSNIVIGQAGSTITGYGSYFNLNAPGGLNVIGGDVVAYASSDKTLKTNITPINNALEKVNKINGILFDWNELAEERYNKIGREAGVIAQEIEEVLPEVVTTRDDGTKAVRYEKLVPLLIEAIKELNKKVEAQNG